MKARVWLLPLIALACLSSASTAAQAPVVNEPGKPTVGRMLVVNRAGGEAIPVRVEGASDAIPVAARFARQAWEYRLLAAPAGEDPTPALNALGGEGWELTAVSTTATRTLWTFKRPK